MKWEYEVLEYSMDSRDKKTLNQMGEEGWELASTIRYEGADAVQFIFKRPKEDEGSKMRTRTKL